GPVGLRPANIIDLQPLSSLEHVQIQLQSPIVRRKQWFDDSVTVPGVLSITLTELELGLGPAYAKKMQELFGNGAAPRPSVPRDLPPQVPKIFVDYRAVSTARSEVPL